MELTMLDWMKDVYNYVPGIDLKVVTANSYFQALEAAAFTPDDVTVVDGNVRFDWHNGWGNIAFEVDGVTSLTLRWNHDNNADRHTRYTPRLLVDALGMWVNSKELAPTVLYRIATLSREGMIPDKIVGHPATASITYGEFEVDVHPNLILLFRNGNYIGDMTSVPAKEIKRVINLI